MSQNRVARIVTGGLMLAMEYLNQGTSYITTDQLGSARVMTHGAVHSRYGIVMWSNRLGGGTIHARP